MRLPITLGEIPVIELGLPKPQFRDGEVEELFPMSAHAAILACELEFQLNQFVRSRQHGRAFAEVLFRLPTSATRGRRPDVAYVSYQRWAKERPIPATDNAWQVVPEVVAEVISPSDIAEDLVFKIDEYFAAGVSLVWVIYPRLERVYVYDAPSKIRVLDRVSHLEGGNVIPGFQLPLSELFSLPVES